MEVAERQVLVHPEIPMKATPPEDPLDLLERSFIDEFLRSRGYTAEVLAAMPKRAAEQVLADAAEEASLLLAQIDSRRAYLKKLRTTPEE
jgi:hypothetical protein